jgi:hypothetical protein
VRCAQVHLTPVGHRMPECEILRGGPVECLTSIVAKWDTIALLLEGDLTSTNRVHWYTASIVSVWKSLFDRTQTFQ